MLPTFQRNMLPQGLISRVIKCSCYKAGGPSHPTGARKAMAWSGPIWIVARII